MNAETFQTSQLPIVAPVPDGLTAVEVFRRLSGLPQVLFFDSCGGHAQTGRYSFVAADPFETFASYELQRMLFVGSKQCGLSFLLQHFRICHHFKVELLVCLVTNWGNLWKIFLPRQTTICQLRHWLSAFTMWYSLLIIKPMPAGSFRKASPKPIRRQEESGLKHVCSKQQTG